MSKFKGELTLQNGMKMVLDMNALATFEELTGKKAFATIGAMATDGGAITDLRALYFSTLIRNQPDITIEDAGEILGEFPEAFMQVLNLASPEPEVAEQPSKATVKKK